MLNFKFPEKGPGLASPRHFSNYFSKKYCLRPESAPLSEEK